MSPVYERISEACPISDIQSGCLDLCNLSLDDLLYLLSVSFKSKIKNTDSGQTEVFSVRGKSEGDNGFNTFILWVPQSLIRYITLKQLGKAMFEFIAAAPTWLPGFRGGAPHNSMSSCQRTAAIKVLRL